MWDLQKFFSLKKVTWIKSVVFPWKVVLHYLTPWLGYYQEVESLVGWTNACLVPWLTVRKDWSSPDPLHVTPPNLTFFLKYLVTRADTLLVPGWFFPKYFGNRSMWGDKYYFTLGEIEPTWGQLLHKVKQTLENLKNSEKLKFPFWKEEILGEHLWLDILLSAILDGSNYQNSQKWLPLLTEST